MAGAAEFFDDEAQFTSLPDGAVARRGMVFVEGVDSEGATGWWTRFFGDVNHAELNWKLAAYIASELSDEMKEWRE